MKKTFKKAFSMLVALALVLCTCSCGNSSNTNFIGDLYLLNFGDYMSDEALDIFEKETGIKVHQDLFEANEEVLPVIESGTKYDIICISDYMIERMIKKDLLKELDKSKLTNYGNLNKDKLKLLSNCDPDNAHAVPYFCGSMGIMYNKDMLDERGIPYPTKWADLWNENLKGELMMQSSIRDLYTVGLMKNGFSPNSTDKAEIDKTTEDFIAQKPYVQGYMVDQIKDKILSGEVGIAPIISGDVQYVYLEGGEGNYGFCIPEEGTCFFVDAWCILKDAENEDNAYKFIDYMLREDIARLNSEYVGYETVNDKAPDEEFLEMKIRPDVYHDYSTDELKILERDVDEAIRYYTDGYNRLKAS